MHFFGSGKIFRSGATGQDFWRRSLTNYLKRIVGTPYGSAGLGKNAHFHIKRCTFSARGKFFGPGPRGKRSAEKNFASDEFAENTMVERRKACKKYFLVFFYENPNPEATFFVCLKLLISLLNGAFLRRGDNFSVRGCGAKFWATAFHQLLKADSKNPSRLLLRSRFGENHLIEAAPFGRLDQM
mgnify:CR=1 FL=1